MIENRDYMRDRPDELRWSLRGFPVTVWLIVINVAFYAAQVLVPRITASPGIAPVWLESLLALDPGDLMKGYVWQLFTFQVLHANLLHLLLNCFTLYVFGRPVEVALGRTSFLKLYFGSGAVGGLLQAACAWAFPTHFGWTAAFGWQPVVGASAGIFGLIAAFAILNSEASITVLLFFVLPVTMRAKYLLVAEAVISIYGLLSPIADFTRATHPPSVAHAAHLGGMLAGIFYVRYAIHWHWRGLRAGKPFRRNQPPRHLVNVHAQKSPPWRRSQIPAEEDLSADEFLAKEVDPILDKISAHGIQSLTERERKILETARKRISKS